MILADKKQKQIIAILTKNDKEFKAELVINETGDPQKSSTNDLTFVQANDLIEKLGGTRVVCQWTRFSPGNHQHAKILSVLMELQWQWYSTTNQRFYADMAKFGHWLQTKAPIKKPLADMSHNEVSKTIFALENMRRKDIDKAKA